MKKKFKGLSLALAAALAAGSLTACQSQSGSGAATQAVEEQTSSDAASDAEETQEEPTDAWGEARQNELFSLYQDMDMNWLRRIDDSITRYFRKVAFQEEFSLAETDYDTLSITKYDMNDADKVSEMLKEKSEPDELDQAFLALYPSMSSLMKAINQIYDYTELKSYLDDDYAKGKEYHKELWDSYQQYTQYVGAFKQQFAQYSSSRLDQAQAQAKEAGMNGRYEIISALKGAIALRDEMDAQGLSDKNVLDMNLETIQPLYQEFLEHVNAVLEVSKHPDELSEEEIPNFSRLEDFVDSMKDTKTSMTLLLQNVKEQKKDSYGGSIAGEGTIKSYQSGLGDMLREYDSLFKN